MAAHLLPSPQKGTRPPNWPDSPAAGFAGVLNVAAEAPPKSGNDRRYSLGVFSLGRPCLSSLPSEISFFLSEA